MNIPFRTDGSFRDDYRFSNRDDTVLRFPFPFAEDQYMYSVNIEPHVPSDTMPAFAHAFDIDEQKRQELALADEHFERVVPGSNGIFRPIIVSKGEVVGTWRRVASSSAHTIEPEHFVAASGSELDAFARAAARYSRFA